MNSKEFEILNEKIDMIFEAIQDLRKDIAYDKQETRERVLTSKAEDAQQELNWVKENRERIGNYYRDVNSNYYNIKSNVERRYEYKEHAYREAGVPMEEKI